MSNIMITKRCNLKCPYCFAHEDMQKQCEDISTESFEKILSFVTRTDDHVGIIGGEPLLHKDIDVLLKKLICNSRIRRATLFTNGVFIDEHIKIISHPKITLLINVNNREDMGESAYARMIDNIKMMFEDYMMQYKTTLGLNLYKPNQDFNNILELVDTYKLEELRLSISVPSDKSIGFDNYFKTMIPTLKQLLLCLNKMGCRANFDCNLIPMCFIDEDLKRLITESEALPGDGRRYVSTDQVSRCNPVIDIHPDGTAIRCFALSGFKKYNIFEFNDLPEIRMTMDYDIDKWALDNASPKCKKCNYHRCQNAMGDAFRSLIP